MKHVRLAVLVVMLASLTPRPASAFSVTDVANLAKAAAQLVLHRLQLDEAGSNRRLLNRLSRRLTIFTDITRYRANNVPRWRTWRHENPTPESLTLMTALNGGVGISSESILAGLLAPDPEMSLPPIVRSGLAQLDARDSVLLAAVDQTGRIRGARRPQRILLNELEKDVLSLDGSMSARLDVISAAGLLRARQQEDRIHLLSSVVEQLIVNEIADREREATAQAMRQESLTPPPNRYQQLSDDLTSWRQP